MNVVKVKESVARVIAAIGLETDPIAMTVEERAEFFRLLDEHAIRQLVALRVDVRAY